MDELRRARDLSESIEGHTRAIAGLKREREVAMRAAVDAGATYTDLARELGLSLGRVVQILGAQQPGRGPVKGAKPAKTRVSGAKAPEPVQVNGAKPVHRHHYVAEGWNHTRGAYLVRQRCECGDVRVVPSPNIPQAVKGTDPDGSIVAA